MGDPEFFRLSPDITGAKMLRGLRMRFLMLNRNLKMLLLPGNPGFPVGFLVSLIKEFEDRLRKKLKERSINVLEKNMAGKLFQLSSCQEEGDEEERELSFKLV